VLNFHFLPTQNKTLIDFWLDSSALIHLIIAKIIRFAISKDRFPVTPSILLIFSFYNFFVNLHFNSNNDVVYTTSLLAFVLPTAVVLDVLHGLFSMSYFCPGEVKR
jgi:hypothetical protein